MCHLLSYHAEHVYEYKSKCCSFIRACDSFTRASVTKRTFYGYHFHRFLFYHSKHRYLFPIISRAIPCSLRSSKSDENLSTLFRTSLQGSIARAWKKSKLYEKKKEKRRTGKRIVKKSDDRISSTRLLIEWLVVGRAQRLAGQLHLTLLCKINRCGWFLLIAGGLRGDCSVRAYN